jgi:broad specificity phosphatase PhoE
MHPDHHRCVLVRHGETEWSLSRRHTGRTDLPLLPEGVVQAEALGPLLAGHTFAAVLCSPLLRARETCRLAGLGDPVIDPDLAEWDYGRFEGLTTEEIRQSWPEWDLFRHGAPEGEDAAAVGARADRVITRVRAIDGEVVCVAHGHLLRVLAVRWAGLEPSAARSLLLSPAAFGVLGWDRHQPAIEQWNLGVAPLD